MERRGWMAAVGSSRKKRETNGQAPRGITGNFIDLDITASGGLACQGTLGWVRTMMDYIAPARRCRLVYQPRDNYAIMTTLYG